MNRRLGVALLAGMAVLSANGEDTAFHKSTIYDSRGKILKVDLSFASGERIIRVVQRDKKKSIVAQIPFDAIEKVSYGHSKRHRVKEGRQTMAATVPCVGLECVIVAPADVVIGAIGGAQMATTSKDHWLYIGYTDIRGSKELVLQLDKSEYKAVLSAAKDHTGKDVEILPEGADALK
jgi:hypothetical protein